MPKQLAVTTNSRDLVEPHKYSNGSLVMALPGHVNTLRGLTRTTHWTTSPIHRHGWHPFTTTNSLSHQLTRQHCHHCDRVQPVNSGGARSPCTNQPYHADARLPVTETENRRAPGARTYSRQHTMGGTRSPLPTNITLIDYAEPPLLWQPQCYVDTIKPSPNLHTS